MQASENLPEAAFFSSEEKVQLVHGKCPRNLTKDRLKQAHGETADVACSTSIRAIRQTKFRLILRWPLHYCLSKITIYCGETFLFNDELFERNKWSYMTWGDSAFFSYRVFHFCSVFLVFVFF